MPQPLWDGGPTLLEAPGVFPLGTDSILLADFARPRRRERILDLGTGSGILPILLLSAQPEAAADAIELEETACRLARENFSRNHLEGRATLIPGDIREFRQLIPAGAYDLTVSNPPYFSENSGKKAAGGLEFARGDHTLTLEELCAAAAWATRWGGRFCVVFRPERLGELLVCLAQNGFSAKRLRPVHHCPGKPVNLVLLEAKRGGAAGLCWENDLYLRTPQGEESPETRRIYHRR